MAMSIYLGGEVVPCCSRVQHQIQRPACLRQKREPPNANPPERLSRRHWNYPELIRFTSLAAARIRQQEIISGRMVGYAGRPSVIGGPRRRVAIAWRRCA